MDWKKDKLRSIWKLNKERLLFLFCSGLLLFILALPGSGPEEKAAVSADSGEALAAEVSGGISGGAAASVSGGTAAAYEERLETRIRELLKGVSGVGEVDVMVTLKSAEEHVFHVDADTSSAVTEEYQGLEGSAKAWSGEGSAAAAGGSSAAGIGRETETGAESEAAAGRTETDGYSRLVRQESRSESTVLDGESKQPVVEKELMPEIAGIVISADGGGSASVKAEITAAMEALLGLPSHKIAVLKRESGK